MEGICDLQQRRKNKRKPDMRQAPTLTKNTLPHIFPSYKEGFPNKTVSFHPAVVEGRRFGFAGSLLSKNLQLRLQEPMRLQIAELLSYFFCLFALCDFGGNCDLKRYSNDGRARSKNVVSGCVVSSRTAGLSAPRRRTLLHTDLS